MVNPSELNIGVKPYGEWNDRYSRRIVQGQEPFVQAVVMAAEYVGERLDYNGEAAAIQSSLEKACQMLSYPLPHQYPLPLLGDAAEEGELRKGVIQFISDLLAFPPIPTYLPEISRERTWVVPPADKLEEWLHLLRQADAQPSYIVQKRVIHQFGQQQVGGSVFRSSRFPPSETRAVSLAPQVETVIWGDFLQLNDILVVARQVVGKCDLYLYNMQCPPYSPQA